MALKNVLLFLIVSALDAFFILLGSFIGHSIRSIGIFAGAIIGGTLGVAAAVWLAARLRLLERASYAATFVGGLIGFLVAAVIAVKNLHGPLIPMASVALIGLGAILGKAVSRKHAA
jgi:peptidoglycan/LPS O-acetylase OafA/YrhL